eukprot:TRINITY_DN10185_c0_g1_i4.p1 TRINITY_DN10185_c0_g1~~TRINITY_DN10185_c0_g1_i4.p1  ORF type:complete len:465 (-),score=36.66 TRINITY_DN10185_c0_g1_i4:142-1536(-)
MVGSTAMVVPLIFAKSGILTCICVLIFVGLVSYYTCDLLVIHYHKNETDVADAVFRILGRKWFYFFSLISAALLFIAAIIYFILCCNVLYTLFCGCLQLFFGLSDFPAKDTLVLSQFSYQWTGIMIGILIFFLFSMKDSRQFVRLNGYGIYCIAIFLLFILGIGFRNIFTKSLTMDESLADGVKVFYVKMMSDDFINVLSTFALAFFIHNCIYPIIKLNRHQENNSRDVCFGYLLTGIIYSSVGIFGSLGVLCGPNDICEAPRKANTVMDYFDPRKPLVLIVLLALALQLLTVTPILGYITRTQLMSLFFKNPQPKGAAPVIFNIILTLSCVIPQIFDIDPKLVIAFNGAVCGFFLVYVIPIGLHHKMLYGKQDELRRSILSPSTETVLLASVVEVENLDITALKDDENEINASQDPQAAELNQKLAKTRANAISKPLFYLGYGALTVYGFGLMCLQLYQLVAH